MFLTIIIFILVLGIIVLVHEFGHFIAARKNGVFVEEFGIGFPPHAATLYTTKKGMKITLNWLPVGGFVKLKGEQGDHSDEHDSFINKKPWRRSIILVAGVTMNIVLAIILFSAGYIAGLPKAVDSVPQRFVSIQNTRLQIVNVLDGSPAQTAGLEAGDIIVSLNEVRPENAEDIRTMAKTVGDKPIQFVYERDNKVSSVEIAPVFLPQDTSQVTFGLSTVRIGTVSYPFWYAIWMGIRESAQLLWLIITALATLLYNLFTQQPVSADLVGPVGVAVITGKFVNLGFIYVLQFVALISLNLAIINIIPFPALDGGRLFFLLIEKIKGSPINQKTEAVIHNVGFIILLILVGFVTVRDILHIDYISNLF